jgi:hypothetical protein
MDEDVRLNLLPCPFCGAGETRVDANYHPPTMSKPGSLITVKIIHWCEGAGLRTTISVVGRDHIDAQNKWNQRFSG